MSDAPVAALVGVAVAAGVLAVLLSVGGTALLRLDRSALTELADRPGRAARTLTALVRAPGASAASVAFVRIALEVVLAVCVTLALAARLAWWHALLVGLGVLLVVALLVVRAAGRTLATRHPLGAALATAGLLRVASVVAPVRLVEHAGGGRDLTDDEVREMVDRVRQSEHMGDEDRAMFRSVLELGETITRTVMVPRTEMLTVPSGTTLQDAMALFLHSGYSRIPVTGESLDDLLGVLYLKDVVRRRYEDADSADEPVDGLARPASFVPESKPVDDLLREMQAGRSHIAIVVDEFGGIAGLVTIEDALEEIVGELTDEHDRAATPVVDEVEPGLHRVPARLAVDELGDLFGLELADADVDTAAGLLAKALGRVPLAGATATVHGLVLTAERIEGRRKQVSTLLVRRADPVADDDASQRPDRPERAAR